MLNERRRLPSDFLKYLRVNLMSVITNECGFSLAPEGWKYYNDLIDEYDRNVRMNVSFVLEHIPGAD